MKGNVALCAGIVIALPPPLPNQQGMAQCTVQRMVSGWSADGQQMAQGTTQCTVQQNDSAGEHNYRGTPRLFHKRGNFLFHLPEQLVNGGRLRVETVHEQLDLRINLLPVLMSWRDPRRGDLIEHRPLDALR